jgi:hypothetical protein
MRIIAVLLLLLSGFVVPCESGQHADMQSGNYLISACTITLSSNAQSMGQAFDDGYCVGLITGASFMTPQCFSGGVTVNQEIRVVMKYLQDHPELLNQSGAGLVAKALTEAFPCNR